MSTQREAHVFNAEPDSSELDTLESLLPSVSRKTDCDPNNPIGGICYNCPSEDSAAFEKAVNRLGLRMQWGAGSSARLKIYRVAADNTFELVGTGTPSEPFQKMVVQGRFIFMCKAAGPSQNLEIWDVGNPSAPELMFTIDVGIDCLNLHAQGRFVYVVGTTGVKIVDVSAPGFPVIRGTAV